MKMKILKAVKVANLPREICNHLHGEEHALSHRMWVGLAVMLGGVFLAHSAAGMPHFVSVAIDMVGYAIHALGATPFIEWLLED
jgi:hypothetical protein